jgi:glycosyltransferase involved in cell wall biosynthesis
VKIAAVCLTYNRPVQLGRIIECFLRQTYRNSELLIYDDGGQYPDQPRGDRWRVVSVDKRSPNLGTKRNEAVKHLLPGIQCIQTWDDDDLYLPWVLEAMVAALKKGRWAQPREALEWDGTAYKRFKTHGSNFNSCAYHGNWGYRLDAFWRVGGYPPIMDDDQIAKRMMKAYGPSLDTITPAHPVPGYAYSRVPADKHLSWLYSQPGGMDAAWQKTDAGKLAPAKIHVGWDIDYSALPIPPVAAPREW